MFGSHIRVTNKSFDDGPTVYTSAMNELFDPSTGEKLLRLFSTGYKDEVCNNLLVAIPKEGKVDAQTLFGNVGDNADRLNIEDTLKLYYHPLCSGQECAD